MHVLLLVYDLAARVVASSADATVHGAMKFIKPALASRNQLDKDTVHGGRRQCTALRARQLEGDPTSALQEQDRSELCDCCN